MQQKRDFTPLDGQRVEHILCNLACKRDGEVPHHRPAKYSELEAMVVEQNRFLQALTAEYGKEHCAQVVRKQSEKLAAKARATPIASSVKKFIEHLVNEMAPDAEPFEMPLPNPGEDKDAYASRVLDLVHKTIGVTNGKAPEAETEKPAVRFRGRHSGETKNAHFGVMSFDVPKEIPPAGTPEYIRLLRDLEAQLIKEAGMPAHIAAEMAPGVLKEAARK